MRLGGSGRRVRRLGGGGKRLGGGSRFGGGRLSDGGGRGLSRCVEDRWRCHNKISCEAYYDNYNYRHHHRQQDAKKAWPLCPEFFPAGHPGNQQVFLNLIL